MDSTTSIAKTLLFGKDFRLASPADCLFVLEQFKNEVSPDCFNPLIPVTGGSSLVGGGRNVEAMLVCDDWLRRCHDAGISSKDAVIGLAAHFDDHMGMVALALEMASVLLKPNTDPRLKLDMHDYGKILDEIFGRNYAGIQAMAEKWGIRIKPEHKPEPPQARSYWRKKLGHDVLMHPGNHMPCKLPDGTALVYQGIIEEATESGACEFKFTLPSNNGTLTRSTFPRMG